MDKSNLEWEMKFLVPNQIANITYFQNEVMGIDLPVKIT